MRVWGVFSSKKVNQHINVNILMMVMRARKCSPSQDRHSYSEKVRKVKGVFSGGGGGGGRGGGGGGGGGRGTP